MSVPAVDNLDSNIFRSVVEHVFLPPKLPNAHPGEQNEQKTNVALCNSLFKAAQDFLPNVPSSESALWMRMTKMIELARRAANAPFPQVGLQRALSDMAIGDVICMHIHAQNAALIVRRLALVDFVQFEVFEVLPQSSAVTKAEGKLLCSYPGPAIQVPTDTFTDECFLQELSSFLVQMDVDHLLSTSRSGSAHPGYISELLVGILRGFGQPAAVDRITKRIGDEVLSDDDKTKPWRRSPLWLILRVSLQSSLRTTNMYKHFVLFFHAHLLRSCVRRDFPSELLFVMRVKMVRRLSKLDPTVSNRVYQFVNNTAKKTEALLSKRWTAFQDLGSITSPSQLKTLNVVADSHITLNNSYDYLTKILRSASHHISPKQFTPSRGFRLHDVHDFARFADGNLTKAIASDPRIAIIDFELSVERNLEPWVAASTNNNGALDVIASCIQQYFAGAKKHYGVDKENAYAEDNSIMILTIMHLWVALDTFAIRECPLLKQYSPEIPSDFLHCLLLHRSSSLKCALYIEEYLYDRHKDALEATSIFSSSVDDSCFALKYFHTSEDLQRLHQKMSTRARRTPVPNRERLAFLDEKSNSFLRRAKDMMHKEFKTNFMRKIHLATCKKCRLQEKAMAMKISIIEWHSMAHAQLAVFELSPPRAFSAWRDITYMILRDIRPHSAPDPIDNSAIFLDSSIAPHSTSWTMQHRQSELVFNISTTTSVSDNMIAIPVRESWRIVDRGLSFRLFDHNRGSWAITSFSESSAAQLCSPLIPRSSSYSHLHRFVSGTRHTPNDIITTQADCPDEINLHEFIAFSGLRSGPRLQWFNIARELASPSLAFSREEVHTLITQAAWQLGPLSNGIREWHIDLGMASFGNTLLDELESLLEKIRASWQEEVTVRTIALICSRLLASTTDMDVCRRTCALLREARNLTFRWIDELGKTLASPQDEKSRSDFQHRRCILAATCFSTFDVCSEYVPAVLASEEDFSIAMRCAVIVHDNTPSPDSNDNSIYFTRMLRRHHRLLHYLEPTFSEPLPPAHGLAELLHARAYNQALACLWPTYRPHESCWRALPEPNSRWISDVSDGRQEVHYDLLTGKLLIGGNRLQRLPQQIVDHSTYASIFNKRIFDVTPADILGMDYMTQSTVSGYQIVFSWKHRDLIVQARKPEDSQVLQFIPRTELSGDFPSCLVDQHIHWLDLTTGELEFRPAASPWTSGPSNWRLCIQGPGIQSRAVLQRNCEGFPVYLIDIRSSTFEKVTGLFSPIESPEHIIATHSSQTLHVSLPRLRLAFFVNAEWKLECRSMPGYVVDKTQSCGTMFGLKNKLVLCPIRTSSEEPLLPRQVIIPQGKISFATKRGFTDVSINTDSDQHVQWHTYTIDTDLGCLTSNTSLRSKLYQCYLHALTSHCLPDPLLGHTGTEEALYILRSAACRSFQRLDVHEAKLLKLISDFTPDRDYSSFPNHSTTRVEWNSLPTLAQHHDFFQTASSVLYHASALEALYDSPTYFISSYRNQTLLNRAAFRNKSYYPSDLHISEQSSSLGEFKYKSRDVSDHGSAENEAFQTTRSIWNSRPSLDHNMPKLWGLMKSWGSLGRVGPDRSGISLRYSRYWLTFNAAQDWIVIYNLCRKSINRDHRILKIKLSFSFSAAAYSRSKYSNTVPFFTIFALHGQFRNLSPPPNISYTLSDGLAPDITRLKYLVSESRRTRTQLPALSLRAGKIVASILHQWPNYQTVDFSGSRLNKSDCLQRIEKYKKSISANVLLKNHVLQLQRILRHYENVPITTAMPYVFSPQFTTRNSSPLYLLRDLLVSHTNVPTPPIDREPFQCSAVPSTTGAESVPPVAGSDSLEILIGEFQNSQHHLLQLYGNELNKSYHELLGQDTLEIAQAVPSRELLLLYHKECSQRKDDIFSQISAVLSPSENLEEISRLAGLWPRITPRSILRLLAHDRISTLPDQWKFLIMRYAVSFIKYQQSLRLLELSSRQKCDEILLEIAAISDDVLAESTPDWLLVQIDANVMARRVQVAVAHEMISPRSKRSISLQLNMGEGKSSVIVPLVASTLANGSNLVRVVTLKPLSNKMFELLTSRLSGLANRPIFYVPFFRGLPLDSRPFRFHLVPDNNASLVGVIRDLYERCIAEGGILVLNPEHILSLKLMHIDTLLSPPRTSDEGSIADELSTLQDWLAKVSRDVLDESDEILHVRYQLIYSAGGQTLVDDHPNRWNTIQQIFSRLQAHALQLRVIYPKMLAIDTTTRGFPIIRILDSAILQQLRSLIIDDALGGRLSNISLGVLPSPTQEAARRFMSQIEVSDVDHALIHSHCTGKTSFNGILLLRGLLMDGEGILGYVLKERRWKVDYGLDPSRTLLAVPYRAKDVPTIRAEFAHPDVAISLTCLSYYYGGLTKGQVILCFDLLAKLDNPEMEYDHWVELGGQDLPSELRLLKGVNMEDKSQVDEFLVPIFSRNKGMMDFYLSRVVFPRDARQFLSKLPTSAWDLVEGKTNVTTGFSGTNDNRYLLPTSITQEDPDFVLRTNALVLQNLLRPENDNYECTEGENGEQESAASFLERLVRQDPEIRVLLDVGAQMLELQNEELARQWLSLRPDILAAIFFNDSDHLMVTTPDGAVESFISSPFKSQLEKCVVYLDDAHTRGTDLKLPRGMRAAVTLGPKVTKDRLVQGCMRMRQLGKGHSVKFFAPGEVDILIRGLIPDGMASGDRIRVLDIVRWAMNETCEDIGRYLPYWAQQGLDHHKRLEASEEYRSTGDLEVLRRSWLQSESRTLEEMYWAKSSTKISTEIRSISPISERIERLGVERLVDVRMVEEQEREVNREVDVNPIARPRPRPKRKVKPAEHIIHDDIREFIETGSLPLSTTRIFPLLAPINMALALDSTTQWSPPPLATADFITTTLKSDGMALTEYLRPVNWILSSGTGYDSVVVVISPYEANELLPIIRKSSKVRLHIYAPRVRSSMRSFSDLTFHSIPESPAIPWSAPAHVRTQLNLFAGQLFFDSRGEYDRVCVLLALSMAHRGAEHADIDGFVPPAYRTGESSPFATSRIPILKTLLELRQKGMGYNRTHMGQILNGKALSEETLNGLVARIIR